VGFAVRQHARRRALLHIFDHSVHSAAAAPGRVARNGRLDLLAVLLTTEEQVKASAAVARIEHSLAGAIRVDLVRAGDGSPSCPPRDPVERREIHLVQIPLPVELGHGDASQHAGEWSAEDLTVDLERI
jgi:hypothetical protein